MKTQEARIPPSTSSFIDLKLLPLMKGLSVEDVCLFESSARERAFSKGTVIFCNEQQAISFFVVKSGWVKLYRDTMGGDEAIIDVLTTGHVLGDSAIFENDVYSLSAAAVEDCTLIEMPLAILKSTLRTNARLAVNMLKSMSRHRQHHEMEIEHRTVQSAPQRIGCFLLKLCDAKTMGKVTLHLPYDKTIIAARFGMQPETFSRALARLKEDIGMGIRGASVEINDIEKLIEYSCSACSASFPCEEKS